MDIKIKSNNLDFLLAVIFGISLVVPSIAQEYGFDTRLFWFPTLCFIFWVLFSGIIKPNVLADDSMELSIIEKLKGWSYVFSLPITLVANYAILEYEHKTASIYPLTFVTLFLALILMVIPLRAVVLYFPNVFFKWELTFMVDEEHKLIKKCYLSREPQQYGLLLVS